MHFTPTILGKLVEPINRRQFQAIVERHDGAIEIESNTGGASGRGETLRGTCVTIRLPAPIPDISLEAAQ